MTKRELIEPARDHKRYLRRDKGGQLTADQVDVGKSLVADQCQHTKTNAKSGEGDTGDRR